MNSSQVRVPPSLAEFGWAGNGESTRGPHGPLASPSSRPPGERSPWSPTSSHVGCRPELFDWPRSLGNLRFGPPASVPQMIATKPTGFARGARSRQARFHPSARAPRSTGWVLAPSTCPTHLPQYFAAECFGHRVLCRAGPRATNGASGQGAIWGLKDPRNQTMYCKDRRGKPLGQEGLIERKVLVQSPRGRSVNRVRSDEGVAWPVQGQIRLGPGPEMSQAETAGCGCIFAGRVTRWNSSFPKENPECRHEENDRNR
jgi:hypothetical protein